MKRNLIIFILAVTMLFVSVRINLFIHYSLARAALSEAIEDLEKRVSALEDKTIAEATQ